MNHPTPVSWEQLLVMGEEAKSVFADYLELLRQEEHALRRMNRQEMADLTERKGQALDLMCRYEQQVISAIQVLTGSEGTDRLWSSLKTASDPRAVTVQHILRALSLLANTIREQGETNKSLIRRTQHVVREAINLIYIGLGTGPVYQGSGALSTPSLPGSMHLHG
jgi:hypothetical protein